MVARAPFAETAWAYVQLLEAEEFEALNAESDRLHAASLMAIAFNEPKRLEDERLSLLARMRDRSARAMHAARTRAQAMVERIQRGQVLSGDRPEGPDGH